MPAADAIQFVEEGGEIKDRTVGPLRSTWTVDEPTKQQKLAEVKEHAERQRKKAEEAEVTPARPSFGRTARSSQGTSDCS